MATVDSAGDLVTAFARWAERLPRPPFGPRLPLMFLSWTLAFLAAGSANAAGWPAHVIKVFSPAPAGGAVDTTARLVGDKLAARLGQPVIVESRPGADGIVAAEAFLAAKDHEHTFLVTFGGVLVNNPVSYDKLPYDAERDFTPVATLVTDTIAICANSSVGADSLRQLFDLMREQPQAIRWASAPGEPRLRFFGGLKAIEARALYVPYKATSQAVTDLIAGRIEVMVAPLASVLPNVRAGKLKVIAVMAPERSLIMPGVPTTAEAGFPQLAMTPFIAMFARSGASPEIVSRLNHEINAVLTDVDVARRLLDAGLSPKPGTPASLGALVATKLQENRDLARSVGSIVQ